MITSGIRILFGTAKEDVVTLVDLLQNGQMKTLYSVILNLFQYLKEGDPETSSGDI